MGGRRESPEYVSILPPLPVARNATWRAHCDEVAPKLVVVFGQTKSPPPTRGVAVFACGPRAPALSVASTRCPLRLSSTLDRLRPNSQKSGSGDPAWSASASLPC